MLRKQSLRKFLATLFTAVYVFVALFSQNFHNHGSGAVFKDFHFQKSEKTFSQSHLSQEFTDCLSCHFLHDGKMLVPQNFDFDFFGYRDFRDLFSERQQNIFKQEISWFQLRGPPSDFI